MNKNDLNDFIADIFQDFMEIESLLKVLKNSVFNGENEIVMSDVANTLEIVTSKLTNTTKSLDKYINNAFN